MLGVRRATLSDLVSGNGALSPDMAPRIESAFGVSMETLLRMQTSDDIDAMRRRADEIDVNGSCPLRDTGWRVCHLGS